MANWNTNKKLKVLHESAKGKSNSELFYTTLNANVESDTAVAINTWARNFVALTTDTYEDTQITETVSINEILAE